MLSGPEIARQVAAGSIVISGFDPDKVGANSYDLTIADKLAVYTKMYPLHKWWDRDGGPSHCRQPPVIPLDPRVKEDITILEVPTEGRLIYPGILYLGATIEYTESHAFVPWIDGRSSAGRLGVGVHVTAGLGDDGFTGQWILECTAVHPIWVFPGMRVCQICFDPVIGERKPYAGKYKGQSDLVQSLMCLDLDMARNARPG